MTRIGESCRIRPIRPLLGEAEGQQQRGDDLEDADSEEVACGQYEKPPVRVARDPGMPTE